MHGTCPVCKRSLTVKLDGTMRAHGREKDSGKRFTRCDGSGQKPGATCNCEEL